MSASSTPTDSPFAFIPSARLAATVDLPTPPLPDATATIARTPGASALPAARGAAAGGGGSARPRLGGQYRGHRHHSRQRLDRLLGRFTEGFEARPALRLDFDRKADIAVAHDDACHHAES